MPTLHLTLTIPLKIFSTLDMKAGYWQIPIKEEDKPKTTFRTSSALLLECKMLSFGLCNVPATFFQVVGSCEICLAYLNDVTVFT